MSEEARTDEVERFRCAQCKQLVPTQYQAEGHPYGLDNPVCVMCVSYYEYLDATEEDDDGGDYEEYIPEGYYLRDTLDGPELVRQDTGPLSTTAVSSDDVRQE